VAFYKDPAAKSAIRPIGIWITWRRIASAHAIMISTHTVLAYIVLSQLAIGLKAGIDIINTTMQVHADRYLSTTVPSRALSSYWTR